VGVQVPPFALSYFNSLRGALDVAEAPNEVGCASDVPGMVCRESCDAPVVMDRGHFAVPIAGTVGVVPRWEAR
jgi:hypothetical protein